MEVLRSSETPVHVRSTRLDIPEDIDVDYIIQFIGSKNHKPHRKQLLHELESEGNEVIIISLP
jgi:hypothetical protein